MASAAAAILALGMGGGTAHAADWLQAKTPKDDGRGHVTISATLLGPQPAGTRLCISLLAAHPMGPDVELESKCKKMQSGTLSLTHKVGSCGRYTTFASARGSVRKSKSLDYCV